MLACFEQRERQSPGLAEAWRGSDQRGIVPRVVADLCARVAALPPAQQRHTTLECSYLEIYNEHLYDLLEPYKQDLLVGAKRHDVHRKRLGLRIREDAAGATSVPQAATVQVRALLFCAQPARLHLRGCSEALEQLVVRSNALGRHIRALCHRYGARATSSSCCAAATPTARCGTPR